MSNIDYDLFYRLLTRSAEIAAIPDMKATVVASYKGVLQADAEVFIDAQKAVTKGESAYAKENKESVAALVALDQPYREARSVLLAFIPTVKLPSTLKSQRTDTDKLNAIEALLDELDDHTGEAWANDLLQGEFGKKAAVTVKEVGESIAANRDLQKAQKARAAAYGPAYDAFIRFKRVVRDALGSNSKEYKRIHVRSAAAGEQSE